MNANQHRSFSENKRFAITIAVIFGGLWLALVAYVLMGNSAPQGYVKPGEVVVHAHSPVATPSPMVGTGSPKLTPLAPSYYQESAPSAVPSAYNFIPSSGSAPSMRLHETSSATVHNIGGGGGGGASTGDNSTSNQGGKLYSAAIGSNIIHVTVPNIAITAVGASNAQEIASIVTETPNAMPGARKVVTDPLDPFLNPVGDVAWPVMILLTIAWCVAVRRRKRQACK